MAEPPDPAQGVYETLLVRHGQIHALDPHLRRLADSLRELYDLPVPAGLAPAAAARVAALPGEHRLRVDVIPERAAATVTLTTSPLDPERRRPLALVPVTLPGGQGAHKWRDRRRLEALRPPGGAVALLLDTDGTVLEAEFGNIWLLDGDRLTTPPADGRILPGVTRSRLLALASSLGLHVREAPVGVDDVGAAAVVFVTSSLRQTVPAALHAAPAGSHPTVERIEGALS